jgi:hypothetical protein
MALVDFALAAVAVGRSFPFVQYGDLTLDPFNFPLSPQVLITPIWSLSRFMCPFELVWHVLRVSPKKFFFKKTIKTYVFLIRVVESTVLQPNRAFLQPHPPPSDLPRDGGLASRNCRHPRWSLRISPLHRSLLCILVEVLRSFERSSRLVVFPLTFLVQMASQNSAVALP